MQRCRFDSLSYGSFEPRRLLAGDVRLAWAENTIYLRGDAEANQVEVVKDIQRTQDLLVRGVNGTTINGRDSIVLRQNEIRPSNGFRVNLGPGDDFIRFEDTVAGGKTLVSVARAMTQSVSTGQRLTN